MVFFPRISMGFDVFFFHFCCWIFLIVRTGSRNGADLSLERKL